MRTISIMVLGLLLAACASLTSPIPEAYSGPKANIADSMQRQSPSKVYFFEVSKVNGKPIETSALKTYQANYGRGFSLSPIVINRDIPAQPVTLTLEGSTYRAADILYFAGGNYHVEGEISIKPEPGARYKVNGQLGEAYAAVWLEDEKGNVVSKKIETNKP